MFNVAVAREVVDLDRLGKVERRLRESGIRVTTARIAVYEQLASLGGHRSADEVGAALAGEGRAISRTTVYSTLELLARLGLVMAADAGPGRALYEANAVWHHHAVCRVCGAVSDVECVVGAKPCLEASGDWGEVDEAQVIFRGTCKRCAGRGHERGHERGQGDSASRRPGRSHDTDARPRDKKRQIERLSEVTSSRRK